MCVAELEVKQRVVRELEKLPPDKLTEVLDFVLFIRSRLTKAGIGIPVRFLPASQLDGLVGLVAWGGDALEDSERLYNGNA